MSKLPQGSFNRPKYWGRVVGGVLCTSSLPLPVKVDFPQTLISSYTVSY